MHTQDFRLIRSSCNTSPNGGAGPPSLDVQAVRQGRNGGFDAQSVQGVEGDAQGGAGIEEVNVKSRVTIKRAPKRDLFAELSDGMTALAEERQGKRRLRTHAAEFGPAPGGDASRARPRTAAPQTLAGAIRDLPSYECPHAGKLWEQGRAKPNAQAALLINLVKRFPDTVERLAVI